MPFMPRQPIVAASDDHEGTTLVLPDSSPDGRESTAPPARGAGGSSSPQANHRDRLTREQGRRLFLFRLACHVVAAAPFLIVAGLEMAQGWQPQGDDAVISFRSFVSLSTNPPLVGMLTHVTSHQPVYDPGPLLFWLLAIPVHIDHLQGALWGSAILCVIAVSLAVEAAWWVASWRGAVVVAIVILIMVGEFPALVIDPTWNAHVGLVWFMATAVIAWAVACGRLRWWPVLVFTGSFAIQSHLMFAIGCFACIAIAPVIGFLRSRRLGWWLPAGLLVGVATWIAPVVQQFTARQGNLSLLIHSQQHSGPTAGIRFALQSLAAAVGPHPIWWGRGEITSTNTFTLGAAISSHPAWVGMAILLGLAVCTGLAWWTARTKLAALSLIALLLSIGTVLSFASVPRSQMVWSFPYINASSWPVGMLVVVVAAWALFELVVTGMRRLAEPRHRLRHQFSRPFLRGRWLAVLPVIAIVAGLVAVSSVVAGDAANDNDKSSGWPAMSAVGVATAKVRAAVPRGRLLVLPAKGLTFSYTVVAGVDYQLYAAGWHPESVPGYPALIGSQVAPTSPLPKAKVVIDYNGGSPAITTSQRS